MRLILLVVLRLVSVIGSGLAGSIHINLTLAGKVMLPVVLLHELMVLSHVLHLCSSPFFLLSLSLFHLSSASVLHLPSVAILSFSLLSLHVMLDLSPSFLLLMNELLVVNSLLLLLLSHLIFFYFFFMFHPLHLLLLSGDLLPDLFFHLFFHESVFLFFELLFMLSMIFFNV